MEVLFWLIYLKIGVFVHLFEGIQRIIGKSR
jgi:hypothetical protein